MRMRKERAIILGLLLALISVSSVLGYVLYQVSVPNYIHIDNTDFKVQYWNGTEIKELNWHFTKGEASESLLEFQVYSEEPIKVMLEIVDLPENFTTRIKYKEYGADIWLDYIDGNKVSVRAFEPRLFRLWLSFNGYQIKGIYVFQLVIMSVSE